MERDMSVKSRVERAYRLYGDSMVLARESEGTTITCKGKRVDAGSSDVVGGNTAQQQVFKVRITTVELAASAWTDKYPKRTDRLTVESRACAVRSARRIGHAGVTIVWELEVGGG
jgi:hypothetical protein